MEQIEKVPTDKSIKELTARFIALSALIDEYGKSSGISEVDDLFTLPLGDLIKVLKARNLEKKRLETEKVLNEIKSIEISFERYLEKKKKEHEKVLAKQEEESIRVEQNTYNELARFRKNLELVFKEIDEHYKKELSSLIQKEFAEIVARIDEVGREVARMVEQDIDQAVAETSAEPARIRDRIDDVEEKISSLMEEMEKQYDKYKKKMEEEERKKYKDRIKKTRRRSGILVRDLFDKFGKSLEEKMTDLGKKEQGLRDKVKSLIERERAENISLTEEKNRVAFELVTCAKKREEFIEEKKKLEKEKKVEKKKAKDKWDKIPGAKEFKKKIESFKKKMLLVGKKGRDFATIEIFGEKIDNFAREVEGLGEVAIKARFDLLKNDWEKGLLAGIKTSVEALVTKKLEELEGRLNEFKTDRKKYDKGSEERSVLNKKIRKLRKKIKVLKGEDSKASSKEKKKRRKRAMVGSVRDVGKRFRSKRKSKKSGLLKED